MHLFKLKSTFICMSIIICVKVSHGTKSQWSRILTSENNKGQYTVYPNYLLKNGFVYLSVICHSPKSPAEIEINWLFKEVQCMEQMYGPDFKDSIKTINIAQRYKLGENQTVSDIKKWLSDKSSLSPNKLYTRVPFQISKRQRFLCEDKDVILNIKDESKSNYFISYFPQDDNDSHAIVLKADRKSTKDPFKLKNRVVKAWEDGMYHFMISVRPLKENSSYRASVLIEMRDISGYLPAIDRPLLPYSGVMSFIYLALSTFWTLLWAKNYEHSKKIHIVIGSISVSASLANTLLFLELVLLNSTGHSVPAAKWGSKVLESVQIALFFLTLMCVSVGYGLTRPKLERSLVVPTIVLSVFYLLSDLLIKVMIDEDLKLNYFYPVLAKISTILFYMCIICVASWILFASIHTFFHLCSRHHSTQQITIFAIFTVACVLSFAAQAVLIIFGMGLILRCRQDWQHRWLYTHFNQMVAFVLLCIIMWLWRPADKLKSYAFEPIFQTLEEEEHYEGSQEQILLEFLDKFDDDDDKDEI